MNCEYINKSHKLVQSAHNTAAVSTLVGSGLQHQHAQLVSGAHQLLQIIKSVLLRDDKQFKYCGN